MNLIVYQCAILLCFLKYINGLKSTKFLKGNTNVEKVCAESFRVFTRVGVSSTTECATVCSEANGCHAIFFSAVNGSCTGCRELTNMSSALVASTANVYYQLVNTNFLQWQFGTSGYMLDVSITMNYTDAKVYCQLYDAHVVVPDSQDEQNFLTDRLSETPQGVQWSYMGLSYADATGQLLVEHSGEIANYSCWDKLKGEPYDYHGFIESCTFFGRESEWKWHDSVCSQTQHVVCEHD